MMTTSCCQLTRKNAYTQATGFNIRERPLTNLRLSRILNTERAPPVSGWSLNQLSEVTAELGGYGRLLLFMYLNKQAHNADEHHTELKQL